MAEQLEKNFTEDSENTETIGNDFDNLSNEVLDTELNRLNKKVESVPGTITYTVKEGDGYSKIIETQIYKYYPKLSNSAKNDRALKKLIIAELERQTGIKNNELKKDQVLTIRTGNITKIIDNYLKSKNGSNNNGESNNGGKIESVPGTITYKVKQGDGYSKIIETEIFKYYPKLSASAKNDRTFKNKIIAELEKQTGIKSKDLKKDQVLTIKMTDITKVIDNYLKAKNGNNNGESNNGESNNGGKIESVSGTITYTVEKGDTFTTIVTNKIFKYYPKLSASNKKNQNLINSIIKEIQGQNRLKSDSLAIGQTLKITMANITNIINKFLEEQKVEIKEIGGQNYIVLRKYEDLKKDHPLLQKIYNDNTVGGAVALMKPRMKKAFEAGEEVIIPDYIENKNSKILKLEDIIKPDKIIKGKNGKPALEGQTFVLDPGHGFDDPGAMGLVKCNKPQKTHAVVYESGMAMDMSYRMAKLLKSHGANVVFTHHMPTRGITDKKDLPPCLESDGKGEYQDVRKGSGKDVKRGKRGINVEDKNKRVSVSNACTAKFISLHADATSITTGKLPNGKPDPKTTKLLPEMKTVSARHMGGKGQEFAEYLIKTGIPSKEGYTQTASYQNLHVIRENKNPAVLIELFNLNNDEQGNQYRNHEERQKKAKEIVDATVKFYGV